MSISAPNSLMKSFLRVPIIACLVPTCSMTTTATATNAGRIQHHAQPHHPLYLSQVFARYLAKQMSQDDITICLIKYVAEDFARPFGVSAQPSHISEGLNFIFVIPTCVVHPPADVGNGPRHRRTQHPRAASACAERRHGCCHAIDCVAGQHEAAVPEAGDIVRRVGVAARPSRQ